GRRRDGRLGHGRYRGAQCEEQRQRRACRPKDWLGHPPIVPLCRRGETVPWFQCAPRGPKHQGGRHKIPGHGKLRRGGRGLVISPSSGMVTMFELKQAIADIPDFPRPGILFRDISPLLRDHFDAAIDALDALLTEAEWTEIDAL